MSKAILKFCNEINANPKLKSEITSKMLEYCKNNDTEQSKVNMINEIILPAASKLGFNFSAEELIDYEEDAKSELTLEDLEGISGGLGIKKTVVSLFAALGLSTIVSSGATSFAMGSPGLETNSTSTSIVQSASGSSTITTQHINTESTITTQHVNTTTLTSPGTSGDVNQDMPRGDIIEETVKLIGNKLKGCGCQFSEGVTGDELHNCSCVGELGEKIKVFDDESKKIAEELGKEKAFESLERAIKNGDGKILGEIFKKIQVDRVKSGLTARDEVAMRCILDDWATLKCFAHGEGIVASPYFVGDKGILWPDNEGYVKGEEKKNILSAMKVDYKIDRYGSENGTYVCAFNGEQPVLYKRRAMANRENKAFYHKYKVVKDFKDLPEVINELGLQNAVQLEEKAVEAYKGIEPNLKSDFKLKLDSNRCGFNYMQLNNLVSNVLDRAEIKEVVNKFKKELDNKPINTDKDEIKKVVDKFKEELDKQIVADKGKIKELVDEFKKELDKQIYNDIADIKKVVDEFKEEFDKQAEFNKQIVVDEGKIEEVVNKAKELRKTLSEYVAIFDQAKKGKLQDVQYKINEVYKLIRLGYINLTDNIKDAKAMAGKIAPAFKQEGGGEQIKLPCSVSLLKTLGFLQDVAS